MCVAGRSRGIDVQQGRSAKIGQFLSYAPEDLANTSVGVDAEDFIAAPWGGQATGVLAAALSGYWPLHPPPERVEVVREGLRVLSSSGAALELRLARLCAHIRQLDLAPLGYPSFRAFAREKVPWRHSRLYQLLKLVCSQLDRIQEAVRAGVVPITRAAQLPGRLEPADQDAWLERWLAGDRTDDEEPPLELITDDEMLEVREARKQARLLLGRAAPVRDVDRWILEAWKEQRSAADLLAEAHAPQPRPDPRPPTWTAPGDPADQILGPWVDPPDAQAAVAELERLCAVRNGRTAALGQLCELIAEQVIYFDLGYDSLEEFARKGLGVSLRTMQRLRRLGRAMLIHPELREAVRDGLEVERAVAIGRWAWTSREAVDWLAIAGSLSTPMLKLVTGTSYLDVSAARRCREVIAKAPAYAEAALTAEVGGQALPAPPVEQRDATGIGTPEPGVRVAFTGLERDEPPIPREWTRAREGLFEASLWLLDTVEVPRRAGFSGATRAAAGHRCENPECRRRTLRLDAHHLHFRSLGGEDTPDNGLALCRSCHLRLVHSGRARVVRVGEAVVWTWPDRQTVVFPWEPAAARARPK